MPWKTAHGSHYHMTEGCHGAFISCDTTGLEPCSDCCGGTGGGDWAGGQSAMGGGTPSPASGSGEFAPDDVQDQAGEATSPAQGDETDTSVGDEIASIGMSVLTNGTQPTPSVPEITPEMVSGTIGTTPEAPEDGQPQLTPEEQQEVDVAYDDYMRTAERVHYLEFAQGVIDEIGEWKGAGFQRWKEENPDIVSEVSSRARRGRGVDGLLFSEYEKSHPNPHPIVLGAYQRLGGSSLIQEVIQREPGYEESLAEAKARAQREWDEGQAGKSPDEARKALKRQQDIDATWSETRGAEAHRRHVAFEQSIVRGSSPVEHGGVMYDQIDIQLFLAAHSRNQVRPTECVKDASVAVRPSGEGTHIVSYAGDGTEETVAAIKSGSFILTKLDHDGNVMLDKNGNPNEWQVDASKMFRRYDMSEVGEDGIGIARSRPERASFVRTDRDIMIMVPWGEGGALVPQYIRKGGYLNIADPNDVYGISEQDFNDTYLRRDGVRYVPPLP